MSKPPIFNEITVYGTYMNPTTGFLQTRIPIPDTGFIPRDPNTLIPGEMFDFVVVVVVQDTATSHLTATVKVREIL